MKGGEIKIKGGYTRIFTTTKAWKETRCIIEDEIKEEKSKQVWDYIMKEGEKD